MFIVPSKGAIASVYLDNGGDFEALGFPRNDDPLGHWEIITGPSMRFGSRGWELCLDEGAPHEEHLVTNRADALGWSGICGC